VASAPLPAKLIGYGSDREQAILRLQRALGEYFVGGIKTNISLFQRILHDADFQEGKLDTGYLDRLLAKGNAAITSDALERDAKALELIAAIASGMFAVLDPASPGNKNGDTGGPAAIPSNWKRKGRSEALRRSHGV
jgi:acetyl-CoA carboxylase, biotin carboxylase subunit